jgi:hypothetical protein
MPSIPAFTRAALATLFIAATLGTARADVAADKYRASIDNACTVWAAKAAAAGKLPTDPERRAKIDAADSEFSKDVKVINIPTGMTENDIKAVISKMRTCNEKAGKAAFGSTAMVSVAERHNLVPPVNLIDPTITISWGASAPTAGPTTLKMR